VLIVNQTHQQKGSIKMTDKEIIEYYDTKINCTLAELSAVSGKSIKALKRILMGY